MATNNNKILYKDLSYKLQGLFFDVRNDLGSGHKESIYQKALEKELIKAGITFLKEPSIKIYSREGEFLGLYRPDFLIENKIIIELKADSCVSRQEIARVYDYLRNSKYELAYLVNFASHRFYIRRFIFTNNRKLWFQKTAKTLVIFVAISFISFVAIRGLPAEAATLYFELSHKEVYAGQPFEVALMLDTEGKNINALEGKISYSQNLKLKKINDGDSIVTLWIQRPSIGNEIVFSGIMPGGYEGNLGPYWKGVKPGKVFGLSFLASEPGLVQLNLENVKILLNDGKGSQAPVTVSGLQLSIKEGVSPEITMPEEDKTPAEEFRPQLVRDPSVFDNQWFLVFETKDRESGIDHYEILESYRKWHWKGLFKKEQWLKAESPYLLQDQGLTSFIYVKAFDRSGNERTAVLPPQKPLKWYEHSLTWIIIILGIIVGYVIWRKLWRK